MAEYATLSALTFGGDTQEYNQVETKTRQSINSIMSNSITYFGNGTIALDYDDSDYTTELSEDNTTQRY
ncbi:MAG: hypothetical protein ACK5MR_18635 [Cumulibacter sp.]